MLIDVKNHDPQASQITRSLLVIWRNPQTREYTRVARLDSVEDGHFVFRYVDSVRNVQGFIPLSEYPDFDAVYVASQLPAFFANRVMSQGRPGYDEYLEWLGVNDHPSSGVPFEVLARTGAERATDTFHVVEAPLIDSTYFESRFFVSGIRHAARGLELVHALEPGARLVLVPEPDNPVSSLSMIISVDTGEQLGWLPNWLCQEVRQLIAEGWDVTLEVERVNSDAPARSKVLAQMRAQKRS